MNDRHPTELLSAYLDGEATTGEQIEVARHLERCEGCRALLEDFRTMAAAASQEAPPAVPSGMTARIMAALPMLSPHPARRFAPRTRLALAVAAGLSVVISGTWVLLRLGRPPEPEKVAEARSLPASAPDGRVAAEDAGDLAAGGPKDATSSAPKSSAAKSSREQTYRPAPPPPPPPAKATPEQDLSGALRSLGYISGGDVQTGRDEAKSKVASREVAPSTPPPGSDAPSKPAEATGATASTEPRTLAFQEARPSQLGVRSLVFERDGAQGTLTDAGLVTLAGQEGACSVDLSVTRAMGEEVRFIFYLVSALPAARPAAQASEPKETERLREAGAAAGSGVGAERVQETRPVKLVRVFPAAPRPLAASEVEQVEERLRHLLDVTARELVTSRCGVPGAPTPPGK